MTIRYAGVERRKLRRLKTPLAGEFGLTTDSWGETPSSSVLGQIRNVSREGLCLETNTVILDRIHVLAEAMGTEKRLFLSIEIPESETRIEALGRVVWYDLASEDSDFRFRAGVLFTHMEKDVKKRWHDFLAAIKKRERSSPSSV
jgi:hypothetical protein